MKRLLLKLKMETLFKGARVLIAEHGTNKVMGQTEKAESLTELVSSLGPNMVIVYCLQDIHFPDLNGRAQYNIAVIRRGKARWFGPMFLTERKKATTERRNDRGSDALIFHRLNVTQYFDDFNEFRTEFQARTRGGNREEDWRRNLREITRI